jgi:hypothetical protein
MLKIKEIGLHQTLIKAIRGTISLRGVVYIVLKSTNFDDFILNDAKMIKKRDLNNVSLLIHCRNARQKT